MRKRRVRPANGFEIPVTPLIDIVFLLLIYFLLASHFIKPQALRIEPPQSKTRAEAVEEKTLTISLSKEGRVFLEGKEVGKEHLSAILRSRREAGVKKVVIEADRRASIQLLVEVMDAVKAAGLEQIMLKTVLISGAY